MAPSFGHGLVLGKFYPPHLGHLHLITEAAAGCGAVAVLVMAARGETLALADRVAWLRAAAAGLPGVMVAGIVCDAPVDYGDPVIWAAQMAVIRAALDRHWRPPVDAVFTGAGRDPRMRVVSVAYVALAPDLPDVRPGGDAAAARWWPVENVGREEAGEGPPGEGLPLAFDHARILADAVWGSAPGLANFRRKVLGTTGFVVEAQRSPVAAGGAGGRPPLLYRHGPATTLHPPFLRPAEGREPSPDRYPV